MINAGDHAVTGGGDGFGLIHLEQLQHQILVFLPLANELPVGCGIAHIAQNHDGFSGTQLITDAYFDTVYRTCVGCCVPMTVNVQFAGADRGTVFRSYLHSITHSIGIILHRNGHFACKIFGDLTGNCGAIRKSHCDNRANRQCGFCFKIHCHQTIQAKDCQSAMLQHHTLYRFPFLGIEDLDDTACQSGHRFFTIYITCFFNLFGQIFQGFLHPGDGRHNRYPVYGGNGSTFCDCIAVSDKEFFQLHGGGDRNGNRIVFG